MFRKSSSECLAKIRADWEARKTQPKPHVHEWTIEGMDELTGLPICSCPCGTKTKGLSR
jgi:hypothetical protein